MSQLPTREQLKARAYPLARVAARVATVVFAFMTLMGVTAYYLAAIGSKAANQSSIPSDTCLLIFSGLVAVFGPLSFAKYVLPALARIANDEAER